VKEFSGLNRNKAGGIFVATLATMFVAVSFVAGTAVNPQSANAQQTTQKAGQKKVKRQFGPGQNALPKGVRQPARRQLQQARQPQQPGADIISKHGKWVVQCDKAVPAANGAPAKKRACAMVQTAHHEKNKQIGLTLIFARLKQDKKTVTMMRIMAPISVYLPTGVALEVDGSAAGRVPFTRCLPQTCMAFAQVRKETLTKMKKGSKGKFLIYEAPGIGIPINLDLTGFTAALESLDKTAQ